jgi:hypothetical protein
MSDLLTHWAIFEDLRRLSQHDPAIDPLFSSILQEEREFARLGAISRGGSVFVPHILQRARQEWDTAPDRTLLRRKLAYALGGVTHFPTDHVFKPLMSELVQADWNDTHYQMQGRGNLKADAHTNEDAIHEISAYYDVYVFRQVYLSGAEEPFNRFLLAENNTDPGRALGEFVYALFQRALLASHTFDPDKKNLDAWLDNLIAKVQPLYIEIDTYTRVFNSPDPAKMAQYQVETAFYDAGDPAIRVARAVQHDQVISLAELESALAPGANRSGYGRTLELGMGSLRVASAFWRGESAELPDLRQNFRWIPRS